jgi:hypothetical protein
MTRPKSCADFPETARSTSGKLWKRCAPILYAVMSYPFKSGKFKGALRKRAGRYRVVFSLNSPENLIEVAAIL